MALQIALIAHDEKKCAMTDWVRQNRKILGLHRIICTATTGGHVYEAVPELNMRRVCSGPLGGDQQIGALIAEGKIDALVFFPDPLTAMPHDVDVKALLRLALVHDIPCALNRRTADLLVRSGCFEVEEGSSPEWQHANE